MIDPRWSAIVHRKKMKWNAFISDNNRLQIVAVILCSTGVALLAYMDAGIPNKKKTMTGVLLAALAAAGSAVYKVSISAYSHYTRIRLLIKKKKKDWKSKRYL